MKGGILYKGRCYWGHKQASTPADEDTESINLSAYLSAIQPTVYQLVTPSR